MSTLDKIGFISAAIALFLSAYLHDLNAVAAWFCVVLLIVRNE